MDNQEIAELAAKAVDAKCRARDSYTTLRLTEKLIQVLSDCPAKKALLDALATGGSTDPSDYVDLL